MHLIDGTQEDVSKAYKTIRQELKLYHPALAQKPEVLALNKCDALTLDEIKEKVKILKKLSKAKVHTISAVARQGTQEVLADLLTYIGGE